VVAPILVVNRKVAPMAVGRRVVIPASSPAAIRRVEIQELVGAPAPFMTTASAPGPLVFRPRRFPMWICFGVGVFLLSMVAIVSLAAAPGRWFGLAFVVFLLVGGPALLVLKIANDLRRTRIVIGEQGLDLCLSRFRIWSFRSLGRARLTWGDVHGVQRYEIPNFAAPGGAQVDYVLHTSQGTFAVSSVQFNDAERIAELVADRIGRPVGALPEGVTPVTADTPSGRRDVRLMRGLGWVAQVAGIVFLALMAMAWMHGDSVDARTMAGVSITAGVLVRLGQSLKRFTLK
jgi:hypothetical protein